MYAKFEQGHLAANSLLPHEMLEMFLFLLIPRVNTNHTAHRLLDAFGSFGGVFSTPIEELEKITGIRRKTAIKLRFFGEFFKSLADSDDML